MAFSTRSGVLNSPFRSGSSPIRRSMRSTRSARDASSSFLLLFAIVFHVIARCFPKTDPHQSHAGGQSIGNAVPDRDHEVFGRWVHPLHPLHIQIEVAMIDVVDHPLLD